MFLRQVLSQSYTDWRLTSLEAATSRLEDIAVHQQSSRSAGISAPTASGSAASIAAIAHSDPIEDPPSIEAWDEAIVPKVQAFVDLSQKIGGNIITQVCLQQAKLPNQQCADASSYL